MAVDHATLYALARCAVVLRWRSIMPEVARGWAAGISCASGGLKSGDVTQPLCRAGQDLLQSIPVDFNGQVRIVIASHHSPSGESQPHRIRR